MRTTKQKRRSTWNMDWHEFANAMHDAYLLEYSQAYADDLERALAVFYMHIRPNSLQSVTTAHVERFKHLRMKPHVRCSAITCRWTSPSGSTTCWKCGKILSSPSTVSIGAEMLNKDLRTLGSVFERAKRIYRLDENPFRGVRLLKTQEKPIRALNPTEQKRLIDHLADPQDRCFVLLALTTGMRRSELVRLKWSQINLQDATLTLDQTKNRKAAIIPLVDSAMASLRFLWLANGRENVFHCDAADFGRHMERVLKMAARDLSIPRFTIHDLRRSFATGLALAGVNEAVARKACRHARSETTMRYYQAVGDVDVRSAVQKLPAAV